MFFKASPYHRMAAQKPSHALLEFGFGHERVVEIVLNNLTRIVGDRGEKRQRIQQFLLQYARRLAKPIAYFHDLHVEIWISGDRVSREVNAFEKERPLSDNANRLLGRLRREFGHVLKFERTRVHVVWDNQVHAAFLA